MNEHPSPQSEEHDWLDQFDGDPMSDRAMCFKQDMEAVVDEERTPYATAEETTTYLNSKSDEFVEKVFVWAIITEPFGAMNVALDGCTDPIEAHAIVQSAWNVYFFGAANMPDELEHSAKLMADILKEQLHAEDKMYLAADSIFTYQYHQRYPGYSEDNWLDEIVARTANLLTLDTT